VDLDTATTIFDKQVHAKRLKGYTEAAGHVPYVGSDKEEKITGVLPQLLNNIEEEDLDDYFDDPFFCMQEKKDGKRILLRKSFGFNGTVEAINRKGLLVGFPQCIQNELLKYQADQIIDGELIGDVFFVFDLLEVNGEDYRSKTYEQRYKQVLAQKFDEPIVVVPAYFTAENKRAMFKKLKKQGVEGVVFKKIDALYKPGRPASKGDQLKFKFTQTCTCQVSGVNEKGKRSVYIQMLDGKELVDVGKVTVLPNFVVPKIGTLVEIKYLYRHVHGALYQPVYLGERDDLDKPDQVSTVKIKEGVDIDEEDS
jgi:bifunctional non-homologous end joining protein LigD